MDDLSSTLDLHRLLGAQVGLSLFASVSHSPSYNLPIDLYGWLIVSSPSSTPLEIRQFLALLVTSFVLDIVWFYAWSGERVGWFGWLLIVAGFLLKPVTLLAGLGNLKQRGQSAFGEENGGFGGLPGSGGGPVWTMPGFSQDAPPPGPSPHSHQHQSSHITNPSNPSHASQPPPSARPSRAGTGSTTYQAFDEDARDVGEVDGRRFAQVSAATGGKKNAEGPASGTTGGGTTEGYHSIE